MMLVGYIRLSLQEPTAERQLAVLRQAGCEKVFIDEINGTQREQPGLHKAWALMQPGDTLVVWRLERLGYSFKQVVQHIEELQRRQLGLRSLQESLDTTGPDGPVLLRLITALVACDRALLSERTQLGLGLARGRGRLGGRPRTMTPDKIQQAAQLMKHSPLSVQQICERLGIANSTFYRYISPTGDVRIE